MALSNRTDLPDRSCTACRHLLQYVLRSRPLETSSNLDTVPETPRWLIRHGRHEQALKVLQDLHSDAAGSHIAEREFEQIQIQTKADNAEPSRASRLELFRDRSYLKRLGIAIGLVCFAQSNGILLIYSRLNPIPSLHKTMQARINILLDRLQLYHIHDAWPDKCRCCGSVRRMDHLDGSLHARWKHVDRSTRTTEDAQ